MLFPFVDDLVRSFSWCEQTNVHLCIQKMKLWNRLQTFSQSRIRLSRSGWVAITWQIRWNHVTRDGDRLFRMYNDRWSSNLSNVWMEEKWGWGLIFWGGVVWSIARSWWGNRIEKEQNIGDVFLKKQWSDCERISLLTFARSRSLIPSENFESNVPGPNSRLSVFL